MERKLRCPVCRSVIPVVEGSPGDTQQCPSCQTTFVMPPRRREAEAGDDDADGRDRTAS